MKKVERIYVLAITLIIFSVVFFCVSYAFFVDTKEEHGKLNVVVGDLKYKLESDSLNDDKIIVDANTSKEIKVKVTSLNDISSKYELYYVLDKANDKVNVGYSSDSKDEAKGTIDANNSKMISVIIRNESDISSTITFKVIGGLVNNDLALKDGSSLVNLCSYDVGYVWNFDYTGGEQEFTVPCSGQYKLETWGAQGGEATAEYYGGYGGYSVGFISLDNSVVYINVGGMGNSSGEGAIGGYNGGGKSSKNNDRPSLSRQGSGGGATHIALKNGLLSDLENYKSSILIVSGGGGGSNYWPGSDGTFLPQHGYGGAAGGCVGNSGTTVCPNYEYNCHNPGTGGTQINGGISYGENIQSGFGIGGSGNSTNVGGAGGGGGFYGGGGSLDNAGGGGGSSYIGNPLLTDKVMYCYNCSESDDEATKTISTTCVSETPTSNCSKQGNGYARITYLGN